MSDYKTQYDANEALIEQASNGDMEPLLDALKSRKPAMSAPSDMGGLGDSNSPDDTLWTQIETAAMDGDLTEDQVHECYAACE